MPHRTSRQWTRTRAGRVGRICCGQYQVGLHSTGVTVGVVFNTHAFNRHAFSKHVVRPVRAAIAAAIGVTLVVSMAGAAGAGPGTAAAYQGPRPWLDSGAPIEQRVTDLLAQMTLDEKIQLMYGQTLPATSLATGYIPGIDRLGIPPMTFSDGPVGLRDRFGVPGRRPATALPSSASLAATFDPALAEQYGALLGLEARSRGMHVLYGPAMNIVRVPVGGRNFEYFSEDPYLTSQLAAPYVRGVQSERVAAQVKHFAVNNQEDSRKTASSNVDERTLREIYLRPWEETIRQAHPWSLMCANNPVNGVYSCENTALLHDVLAGEWGFDGVVGSDYAATHSAVGSVQAGLDQSFTLRDWGAHYRDLPELVRSGAVAESTIDERVRRILRMIIRIGLLDGDRDIPTVDVAAHGAFARKAAAEGTVLLRNDRSLLPINTDSVRSIAVLGSYAVTPYTGGRGSSRVLPYYTVSPVAGITTRAGAGISVSSDDGSDPARAAALAAAADLAVVVIGDDAAEGSDRTTMDLPAAHNDLVERVVAANPNTIVVLNTGAPVTMPWLDRVHTLVEVWYAGQEVGNALADVLFGDVDPSGRLPVTFPTSADQSPSMGAPRFPAGPNGYDYTEGLHVGYRGYDAEGLTPLFPFGYGLSYTSFTYSKPCVTPAARGGDGASVSFTVTNTGQRAGTTVAQVYVGFPAAAGEPPRQLAGFERVTLPAGGSQRVTVKLPASAFRVWSVGQGWKVPGGRYTVQVGTSSRDLPLSVPLLLAGTR